MFPLAFLVTVLAIQTAAKPVVVDQGGVTLELSRRVNATSMRRLLEHDQRRAKVLRSSGVSSMVNAAVVNQPVISQAVTYVANVGIGSPPTTCMSPIMKINKDTQVIPFSDQLIIDTGRHVISSLRDQYCDNAKNSIAPTHGSVLRRSTSRLQRRPELRTALYALL